MKATGILVDGSIVKRASIKRAGQQLFILDLQSYAKNAKVKQIYTESFSDTLISGIHADDLVIRFFPYFPTKKAELKQALALQTEAQLHLNPDELITSCLIEKAEQESVTFSTTKSALSNHLKELKALHLDPEHVSAIPLGLKALVKWKAPELSSYFLLDIGLNTSNCIWVENDQLKKAHAVRSGLEILKTAFYEDRKKLLSLREQSALDFSYIKTSHYPALTEAARNFRREIAKILHSFSCQRPLIFTGEIEANGFCEFLLEVLRDNITEEIKLSLMSEERSFAVPLGLAIDHLMNTAQPIQFRVNPSLSNISWKKLGVVASVLLAASTAFSLLFFGIGSYWIREREEQIVKNLESWSADKDPALRQELFSAGTEPHVLVEQWLKLIEKNGKDYRFLMKAPKVSEFLNQLFHHPFIESLHQTATPISFEQIHYQLVSLPRLDSPEDPYLVKVELSFKLASAQHARKFHELLLQGFGSIDPSRDITWDVQDEHYLTAFYLKNE